MARDGEIKDAGMQWQTTMITASNASLQDSIRSTGNDALATRIFEIATEIPAALRAEFAGDTLKDTLRNHSGHAGARFLAAIVQPENLAKARHGLEKYSKDMWQATGLPQQYRFWVRLAASIAVASEIVKGIGLLEFSPQRILEWLVKEMKAGAEYSFDEDDGTWILAEISRFVLEKSAGSTVGVEGPFFPGQTGATVLVKPTREIMMRTERSNGRIYIAKSALRDWAVKQGVNMRDLIQGLVKIGVCLNVAKSLTLGAGTDFATGQVKCLELDGRHPAFSGVMVDQKQNVLPLRSHDPNADNSLGGMEETY
jgi:hypothetical protein